MKRTQPWLSNPLLESALILSPAILSVALIFIFKEYFLATDVSTIWWIVLVLCIDVSHVYSTLFRLYWDKQTFQKYKQLLIIIPVAGFIVALSVHLYDTMLFWRLLAYIAVYHFVRQQYGFMRLYSRQERINFFHRAIDACAIYNATLYPILYWHIMGTEKIAWFVKGDFVTINLGPYQSMFSIFYYIIIALYLLKEIILIVKRGTINIPKNMVIVGTYLSWYFGIVAFQGDLIFTLLNVVSHGIPYMALIWIYGKNRSITPFPFGLRYALIFISVILTLAYFEETLWDNIVWKEHSGIFPSFLDSPIQSHMVLSALVALLVLPQITHYVLDGFIWRFSKDAKTRI